MRPLDDEPDFEPMRKQRGDGHSSQANKGKVKRRLVGGHNFTRAKRHGKGKRYGR